MDRALNNLYFEQSCVKHKGCRLVPSVTFGQHWDVSEPRLQAGTSPIVSRTSTRTNLEYQVRERDTFKHEADVGCKRSAQYRQAGGDLSSSRWKHRVVFHGPRYHHHPVVKALGGVAATTASLAEACHGSRLIQLRGVMILAARAQCHLLVDERQLADDSSKSCCLGRRHDSLSGL
jgi:hypothetical protein